MNYTVNISKVAKQDLYDIYRYIADELLSKSTAINQLKRIEDAILSLATMPKKHRVYDEKINPDIRFLPVNNYLIFYIVNEKDFIVNIVRVLYGGRNFRDIL